LTALSQALQQIKLPPEFSWLPSIEINGPHKRAETEETDVMTQERHVSGLKLGMLIMKCLEFSVKSKEDSHVK